MTWLLFFNLGVIVEEWFSSALSCGFVRRRKRSWKRNLLLFVFLVEKKLASFSLSKVIISWIWEIRCEGHFQIARSDEVEDNGNHHVQENQDPLMYFVFLKFCSEGKLYARCWLAAIVAAMGLVSKLLDAEHAHL